MSWRRNILPYKHLHLNVLPQWNSRGIKAKRNKLPLQLTDLRPAIICLRETFFKVNDQIKIKKNYENYNYTLYTRYRDSVGVSVLIKNDIPQSKIDVNVELEAITIKATLHRLIDIFVIYSAIWSY